MTNKLFIIFSLIAVSTFQTAFGRDKYSLPDNFAFPKSFNKAAGRSEIRIKQRARVRFPTIGLVEVRAVEESGTFPRIEFVNPKTRKTIGAINLGTRYPDAYKDGCFSMADQPCAMFKVIRPKGFPTPLVLALGVAYGGSDDGYGGTIIGAVDGKFVELLPQQMFVHNQGGMFVGYLGRKYGFGAVSWTFIWEDNAHYAPHRYQFEIYPFDKKTRLFTTPRRLETKREYERRGESALKELRLPVRDLLRTFPRLGYLKEY